ncbi:unnamed protein product [Malus baccata var. baccata]
MEHKINVSEPSHEVTNPASDPLREGLVMSLEMNIGKQQNILEVGPENASQDSIQGNTSIRDSEVATMSVVDYTNEFKTDEVFKSKNDLLDWTRAKGKKNNMVIVIKRYDAGGVDRRRKRARITFACERHGEYRSILRKSDINDQNSDANNKKKEPRNTGTKKCRCPFMLKGVNVGEGDEWKLEKCWVYRRYGVYVQNIRCILRMWGVGGIMGKYVRCIKIIFK